jgi:hypothetical protein
MKAYKVTLLIVDHDELGEEQMTTSIENVRYPNRCLSPRVMAIESRDIGEWHDDHPLNLPGAEKEYTRLFDRAIQ